MNAFNINIVATRRCFTKTRDETASSDWSVTTHGAFYFLAPGMKPNQWNEETITRCVKARVPEGCQMKTPNYGHKGDREKLCRPGYDSRDGCGDACFVLFGLTDEFISLNDMSIREAGEQVDRIISSGLFLSMPTNKLGVRDVVRLEIEEVSIVWLITHSTICRQVDSLPEKLSDLFPRLAL